MSQQQQHNLNAKHEKLFLLSICPTEKNCFKLVKKQGGKNFDMNFYCWTFALENPRKNAIKQ
jgi:hypothetical protein